MRPVLLLLVPCLVLLLWPASPSVSAQTPPIGDLPYADRGPYTVGTKQTTLAAGDRTLTTTIWYPAAPMPDDTPTVTYTLSILAIEGSAFLDAPPLHDGTRFPVVIFSHGAGLTRIMYSQLLEQIASWGYVIVAPDHPTNTMLDGFLDDDQLAADIGPNFAWRILDLATVLDFVGPALNAQIDGIADTDRIALAGHSFGGYTALVGGGGQLNFDGLSAWCAENAGGDLDPQPETSLWAYTEDPYDVLAGVCFLLDESKRIAAEFGFNTPFSGPTAVLATDPRVRSIVAYAPYAAPLFADGGLAALEVPILLFGGTSDRVTPYLRDVTAFYAGAASQDKTLITLEDGGHALYLNDCPPLVSANGADVLCSDPVWDLSASRAIIGSNTIAFLEDTLKGQAGVFAPTATAAVSVLTTRPQP